MLWWGTKEVRGVIVTLHFLSLEYWVQIHACLWSPCVSMSRGLPLITIINWALLHGMVLNVIPYIIPCSPTVISEIGSTVPIVKKWKLKLERLSALLSLQSQWGWWQAFAEFAVCFWLGALGHDGLHFFILTRVGQWHENEWCMPLLHGSYQNKIETQCILFGLSGNG